MIYVIHLTVLILDLSWPRKTKASHSYIRDGMFYDASFLCTLQLKFSLTRISVHPSFFSSVWLFSASASPLWSFRGNQFPELGSLGPILQASKKGRDAKLPEADLPHYLCNTVCKKKSDNLCDIRALMQSNWIQNIQWCPYSSCYSDMFLREN